jgi:hypothetical protein
LCQEPPLAPQFSAHLQCLSLLYRIEIDQSRSERDLIPVASALAVPGPGPCLGQSLALLGQPVRPPLRVVVGKVMTKDERSSGNDVVVATPQRGSILIPTSTETE